MRRQIFTLALVASLASGALDAQISGSAAHEEEADDEGDEIAARARLDRELLGGISPAARLDAVSREYRTRSAARARSGLSTLAASDLWLPLGPGSAAGRMTSIAAHPTATGTLYAGAAGGGVWKTTNGGASWTALTDDVGTLSVGAVALAPSAPATIYAGTGEGGRPDMYLPGIGLLKSTDGGATWALPGSVLATQFFRISVHPASPGVLVAATSSGAFRSTDGGATFTNVISREAYGFVSDLARDLRNPETLYAATWCPSGVPCSYGPSRILKSTDGGASWAEKSAGIARSTASSPDNQRLAIAVSASNPLVLYAALGLESGGVNVSHIYKSMDGAESWTDLPSVYASPEPTVRAYMGEQSWYDNVLVVSPRDANVVLAGGVYTIRSTDGGRTFSHPPLAGALVHLDAHDLAFQGGTLYIANDGGVYSSVDDGETAAEKNSGLVTRQYYSVAQHPAHLDRILAGAQDNGTDQRVAGLWRAPLGGDGFDCAFDPFEPDAAYATAEYGRIFRTTASGTADAAFPEITPPYAALGDAAPFKTVLLVDPAKPGRLLTGGSRVLESTDRGVTWKALAAATMDGSSWSGDSITALALSRADGRVLYAAKGGAIYRSGDGGASWTRSSRGLPGTRVNGVEADPRVPAIAWAAVAAGSGASVYQTTDGGASWNGRSAGLPQLSAHVVRAALSDPNVLTCGTDVGVYRSTDGGASWSRFGSGLPAVSVRDLKILDDGSLLRVATHGRGIWELQGTPGAASALTVRISITPETGARAGQTISLSATASGGAGGTTYSWRFGDGATASVASAAHAYAAAGTYQVVCTARDAAGTLAEARATVLVTAASAARTWLVAGMAYTDGASGTFWQSDLSVFNPDASRPLALSIAFLDGRNPSASSLRWVAVAVQPLATSVFQNVLGAPPLALPRGSFGAILVRGDSIPSEPILAGRTYNTGSAASGTFGLSVPAVVVPNGTVGAQSAEAEAETLIGLREVPGVAHTNLVLANLRSEPASVDVRFLDARGAPLGAPLRVDLAPYAVRQLNRALAAAPPDGAGVSSPAPSFAALVTALSGGVFPYATVIDDRSSDPIVISPSPRAAPAVRLPGIVRTRGKNDTVFLSDVVLHNPVSRARTVSVRYTYQAFEPGLPPSAPRSVTRTLAIGPRETVELDDFVALWLGLSGAPGATGYANAWVDAVADGAEPLLVLGQTYNAKTSGRVGFQIPGYTPLDGASAAGPSRRLVMTGLSSSAASRTNVAFFLTTSAPGASGKGTLRIIDRNGRQLATRALSLDGGNAFVQLNDSDLFAGLGSDGSGLTVILQDVSGDTPIASYATVIDNVSGDAILVPGQPSP